MQACCTTSSTLTLEGALEPPCGGGSFLPLGDSKSSYSWALLRVYSSAQCVLEHARTSWSQRQQLRLLRLLLLRLLRPLLLRLAAATARAAKAALATVTL